MNPFLRCSLAASTALMASAAALPAGAIPLGDDSGFGPTAVVESFEGIAANGQDLPIGSGLTLPSGIVINAQDPVRTDSFTYFIVNGGFFGLGPASPDVPDGTAYFGQANPGLFDDGVLFDLPEPATRVGAFVATASSDPDGPVEVSALDANGQVIESVITRGVSSAGWANNFVGFESTQEIHGILFDGFGGGVLRIDQLQYVPVPEPASAVLLGLAGLMIGRRRGVR